MLKAVQQSAIQGFGSVESKSLMTRLLAELFQLADPKKDGERLIESKAEFEARKEKLIQGFLAVKLYNWVEYLQTFYFSHEENWAPYKRMEVLESLGKENHSIVMTNNFVESCNRTFKYFTMVNQRGRVQKVLVGLKEFTISVLKKSFKKMRTSSLFAPFTKRAMACMENKGDAGVKMLHEQEEEDCATLEKAEYEGTTIVESIVNDIDEAEEGEEDGLLMSSVARDSLLQEAARVNGKQSELVEEEGKTHSHAENVQTHCDRSITNLIEELKELNLGGLDTSTIKTITESLNTTRRVIAVALTNDAKTLTTVLSVAADSHASHRAMKQV